MSIDDESSAGPVVDSRGLLCPAPIIELARAVRGLPNGTVITLLADDPAVAVDVPAWCRLCSHDYLGAEPLERIRPSTGAPEPAAAAYRVRVVVMN